MKDVIEMLLKKQTTLEADKEAEKALACEEIEAHYAERASKYSALLEMAGYKPPVETVEAGSTEEEAPVEVAEEAPAEVAESGSGEASEPLQVY